MRTGQPIISRPAWYDRNPIQRSNFYVAGTVAPHTSTQRWSYTCPSGKKAMVEVLMANVMRDSAATTVGVAESGVFLSPGGSGSVIIVSAEILENTVGARNYFSLGVSLTLLATDVISGSTFDASTGGTCRYQLSYKIIEYDA